MRKNKFFNIFFLIITFVYAIILLLNVSKVYPFVLIERFWFETFLFFISILMITRATLFKSDSSLFVGVCLISNAIIFFVRNIYNLRFLEILPLVVATFAISSLLVYLFFRNRLYFKSFFTISLIALLCCNIYWIL